MNLSHLWEAFHIALQRWTASGSWQLALSVGGKVTLLCGVQFEGRRCMVDPTWNTAHVPLVTRLVFLDILISFFVFCFFLFFSSRCAGASARLLQSLKVGLSSVAREERAALDRRVREY